MTNETRKIWDAPDVMSMATCIRVPVMRAHAESINIEFEDDITEAEARDLLAAAPGVSIIDDRCAERHQRALSAVKHVAGSLTGRVSATAFGSA